MNTSQQINHSILLVALTALATVTASPTSAQQYPDRTATSLTDRAIDLMGGAATLRGVERVALEMMTVWQSTSFEDVPHPTRPISFEEHTDIRDYTIPAWRNTRRFPGRNIINIIRGEIALTNFGNGFQPLSVAYVDEREELFAYTPDRLMLLTRDADDLALAPDTIMSGERYRSVTATLAGRYPARVFLHAGTGLPRLLRFHASHVNDWGLVPWGEMQVDVWYYGWRAFGNITIPVQWDIDRVGAPYKRMTVRGAVFNPVFDADSFPVTAELRARYLDEAVRPMHEYRTVDSTKSLGDGLIANYGFGLPAVAVELNDGWFMLETGQAPFIYQLGVEAFREAGADRIAGVLAGYARTANGGVVAAAEAGIPIYVSRASGPFVQRMLANANRTRAVVVPVESGLALGRGERTLRLEPVDLSNHPGSVMVFYARAGWLYLPDAASDLDTRLALDRAHRLGWVVRTVRDGRGIQTEVTAMGQ